jgi:hypothetical protein
MDQSTKEIRVVISTAALTQAINVANEYGNTKTGGLAIGFYGDEGMTAFITEMMPPPPDSEHSEQEFVRGTDGLREHIQKLWEQEPKRYYLGEWHTHNPGATAPDLQDAETMLGIAKDQQEGLPEPILVILTPLDDTWMPNVYAALDGHLICFSLEKKDGDRWTFGLTKPEENNNSTNVEKEEK